MAQAGDMLQKMIDELFSGMPNVFSIDDNILIVGFDEMDRDHKATLDKVLGIYRKANMKLKKDNCPFRCTCIPFLM